jgi:tRNA-splicing ligase RtcB
VQRIAVMPDVHWGEGSCVGVVLATRTLVYPQAVGSDIGCGVTALRLDGDAASLDLSRREGALAVMGGAVPILRHHSHARARNAVGLEPSELSDARLAAAARREGRIEFGTLGRGNHFLEIQADEADGLWLVVHSGSRAMGQIVTHHHTARAARVKGGLVMLDTSTDLGEAYVRDAAWAARYAAASREQMLKTAAEALGRAIGIGACDEAPWGTDHNHVRRESHGNKTLLVHRKGASPAGVGVPVIIPGSMATATFHAVGRGGGESLDSCSHGAGRAMARSVARRAVSEARFLASTESVTFDRGLAVQLVDESPEAYRDVRRVMRAQRELVRVERVLRPLVCLKGV